MSLTEIAVLIAIAGLIILILYFIDRGITAFRLQHADLPPTQAQVLDALQHYVTLGMMAAERLAADELKAGGAVIDGLDKAAIANSAYDLIPNDVVVAGRTIPISLVKTLVTRTMFENFVKSTFDAIHAQIMSASTYFRSQVEALDNPTGSTPALGTKMANDQSGVGASDPELAQQ